MWWLWTACFAIGVAGPWLAWELRRRKRLPVTVTIDEADPQPEVVAGYLAEIAVRLDERPERMRIRFNAPPGITLDLDPDGRLAIRAEGAKPHLFSLRGRWIADHPVPFALRNAVLYVDPVDANRFRVSDSLELAVPAYAYVIFSFTAVAALLVDSPCMLAAAIGITVGSISVGRRWRRQRGK